MLFFPFISCAVVSYLRLQRYVMSSEDLLPYETFEALRGLNVDKLRTKEVAKDYDLSNYMVFVDRDIASNYDALSAMRARNCDVCLAEIVVHQLDTLNKSANAAAQVHRSLQALEENYHNYVFQGVDEYDRAMIDRLQLSNSDSRLIVAAASFFKNNRAYCHDRVVAVMSSQKDVRRLAADNSIVNVSNIAELFSTINGSR